MLGNLFIVDAGTMHGVGVLNKYRLHYVNLVSYHSGKRVVVYSN